jgi:hypothetical protein
VGRRGAAGPDRGRPGRGGVCRTWRLAGGWCVRPGGVRSLLLVAAVALMLPADAAALDLFTLWRQPGVPLHIAVGDRVDYQLARISGGRRSTEVARLQCVGSDEGSAAGGWVLEVLPLREEGDRLVPIAGQGWRLVLSRQIDRREGRLIDLIEQVTAWDEGQPRRLEPAEWRDDPLISSSLSSELPLTEVEQQGATDIVVDGRSLACRQLMLAAADTQRIAMPGGDLLQVTRREITAAVQEEVPFLGIVYATERASAISRLDPPSERFRPPPPSLAVQTMELVDYGHDAVERLAPR